MKSTLIKIFLILNLVFCAGVLVFSFQVFNDRELVKARNVLHQNNLDSIAGNLNWGSQVAGEDESLRQSDPFLLKQPDSLKDMESLTVTLENLSAVADARLNQLSGEHTDLMETRAELEETGESLAAKENELRETRVKVADLENSLADARESLEELTEEGPELEGEIATLESRVEDLDRQIATREEHKEELSRAIQIRTGERDRIETLLAAARRPVEQDGSVSDWHQKTAKVLAAEPEWNYVVINKGEVDVLPLYVEAFVHRGDEFIGKIRVIQVERAVALAEVLTGTLTQGAQVQSGDTLFF